MGTELKLASLGKMRSKRPHELTVSSERVRMALQKKGGGATFSWYVSSMHIFLLNDSELILPFGNVSFGKGS